MKEGAFFNDGDLACRDVVKAFDDAFSLMELALSEGKDVVIPTDGIGPGLADLPRRAPRIFRIITDRIAGMEKGSER